MLTMNKLPKIILLDADVISHFIVCNELVMIDIILEPHSIIILDKIYSEISRLPSRKVKFDVYLSESKSTTRMNLDDCDVDVRREYALIKRNNPLIGDGERACMAVAKFDKRIIASSNFRDIVPYCKANKILYLGTLDILTVALKKGIFDTTRCNQFISNAIAINKARFPVGVSAITDYKAPDLSFI